MSNQSHLRLITSGLDGQERQASIVKLAQSLIRFRTQGGIDPPQKCLEYLRAWLLERGIEANILSETSRASVRPVGVLASVSFGRPGPTYALTACVDTAPLGSEAFWSAKPDSGFIDGDKLFGRGAADSKTAAAIFCHLAWELNSRRENLRGRLLLLLDADEHTGRFGAIKALLKSEPKIDGVFIGYPGNDALKVGARGFARARLRFWAPSGHTGSRNKPAVNVFEKASWFVREISSVDLTKFHSPEFGMMPKVTVTSMHGGGGYTMYADSCSVNVDMRLVPGFGIRDAQKVIQGLRKECDIRFPWERGTSVKFFESWPHYRLDSKNKLVRTLQKNAEREFGKPISLELSGPSNVGNFLSSKGIDATCGFGVTYEGIHANDEYVLLSSIPSVYRSYRSTLAELLN